MFLICGEALLDIFIGEERPDGLTLDARPGGSPFNVALGLSRLGQKAEFFSGLSNDLLGERLLSFLRREGVGSRYLLHKDLPTTLSIVGLDRQGSPAYAFYGEGAADRGITREELPELGEEIRVIHVGSFAMAVEPVGSALDELVRRESGRRLISYDPNVRLTVEPSTAHWRQLLESFTGLVQLLKISREDLDLLYDDLDPEEAAARWIANGVKLVVITDGSRGATGWTRHEKVFVPAQPVEVIDSVGAGDSFQAALLAGLAERGRSDPVQLESMPASELQGLLAFAVEAAALTCSRRGADLPRRDELTS